MSKGSKGQKNAQAFNPDWAHLGPFELPHPWNSLTAFETAKLLEATGVKCVIRWRRQ